MDVTKLFEKFDDKIPALDLAKLDTMAENAMAYPQFGQPANQNVTWVRSVLAVAAALVMVVTLSLQLSPVSHVSQNNDTISYDAYSEISDLLMLETLNDLS